MSRARASICKHGNIVKNIITAVKKEKLSEETQKKSVDVKEPVETWVEGGVEVPVEAENKYVHCCEEEPVHVACQKR
jgi:hypothetical protein